MAANTDDAATATNNTSNSELDQNGEHDTSQCTSPRGRPTLKVGNHERPDSKKKLMMIFKMKVTMMIEMMKTIKLTIVMMRIIIVIQIRTIL